MKKALICFTRLPRPGRTKTRLMPFLSEGQCARLHLAFLQDLSRVYGQMDADLFVAYAPDPHWDELRALFPMAADFFPQEGLSLGERMHQAILRVLNLGYDAAVLTGSDLPLMGKEHLYSGFRALEAADVAIGPTADGGYYLIGMKKACPALFRDQEYGGATVFENTLAAAKAAGCTVDMALCCSDVDRPEDLQRLAGEISLQSAAGKLLQALREEGVSL